MIVNNRFVDEKKLEVEKEIGLARKQESERKKAEERRKLAQKKKESNGGYSVSYFDKSNSRIATLEGTCELCKTDGPITATDEGDFCVSCLAKIGSI
jgi:hypothetical protein